MSCAILTEWWFAGSVGARPQVLGSKIDPDLKILIT